MVRLCSRCLAAITLLVAGMQGGQAAEVASRPTAAQPAAPACVAPLAWQVVQREQARAGKPGSGQIALRVTGATGMRLRARATSLPNGTPGAWGEPVAADGATASALTLPAGWYRIDIELLSAAGARQFHIEPVGVGEVFLVAGQSYADNCSAERLRVGDKLGRVTAYDWQAKAWRKADDPQPTASKYRAGSIWPALGDALVERLKCPVAFANVSRAATSSAQWLPGGELHRNLRDVGRELGRFRLVLWQQGESDVMAGTTREAYVANLERIRAGAEWDPAPPWMLAQSTIHPSVYNNPAGQERIRTAIAVLWERRGFTRGPDTDTLTGEHRDLKGERHWSGKGQRAAAALWSERILAYLKEGKP